ncbi:MAG: hypothetical protein XD91_1192 [Clostridiales bacterium 38_11]|nr:MAG: hypothetical protein XD91_1192 [Clostridiales bacterium 38_11]
MAAVLDAVVFDVVATTLVFEHEERTKTEQTIKLVFLKSLMAGKIFTIAVLYEFKVFMH